MGSRPLIYLVGGAMRTGKSQVAHLFNARTGISYVSTDDLRGMLGLGAPELGIGGDAGITWQENRMRLAPLAAELARQRARHRHPLLIEGELLPEMVGRLCRDVGTDLRACFLGTAEIAPTEKLGRLLAWSLEHKDWLYGEPRSLAEWAAGESVAASLEYRDAARSIGIPYFDLSRDFDSQLEAVVGYLVKGHAEEAGRAGSAAE